jgi:hypothetical protein
MSKFRKYRKEKKCYKEIPTIVGDNLDSVILPNTNAARADRNLSGTTDTFRELLRVCGTEIDTNSAVKDIIHFLEEEQTTQGDGLAKKKNTVKGADVSSTCQL